MSSVHDASTGQIESAHNSDMNEEDMDTENAASLLMEFQNASKKLKMNPTQIGNTEDQNKLSDTVTDGSTILPGDSTVRTKKQGPNTSFRYPLTEKGHCKVLVQLDPQRKNSKEGDRLNKVSFGRLLHARDSIHNKAVVDIKSNGIGKLCILMKSAADPANFCRCQGVIRDVPVNVSNDEIKQNLEVLGNMRGRTSVADVRRLNKKFRNSETGSFEYKESLSVLVTFNGTELPDKVALYKASSTVSPYTQQVRMCLKCLRYGHIASQCRSSERCVHCSEQHSHSTSTPCPHIKEDPKCVHCPNESHRSDSKDCPELIFQKQFRSYAVVNSVTFAEAKAAIRPRKTHSNNVQTHFNFS